MTARADVIIKEAERILREKRGRSAPDQNQSSPPSDWTPVYRYFQGVVLGCVAGLMVGFVLGVIFPPSRDTCQVRASSAHMSICLDAQLKKAKELVR